MTGPSDHRQAPLPATYNKLAPYGVCKWCGGKLRENANGTIPIRRRFHRECGMHYSIITSPAYAYWYMAYTKGHQCAVCDTPGYPPRDHECWREIGVWIEQRKVPGIPQFFDLDHIVPLWSVAHLSDEARLNFFLPGNLQLLCPNPCHAQKTAREAKQRAKVARIASSGGLMTKKPNARERWLTKKGATLPF